MIQFLNDDDDDDGVDNVPVHSIRAYKGSGVIVPLIHNLGCRWR
jgi:hypothetical protein